MVIYEKQVMKYGRRSMGKTRERGKQTDRHTKDQAN